MTESFDAKSDFRQRDCPTPFLLNQLLERKLRDSVHVGMKNIYDEYTNDVTVLVNNTEGIQVLDGPLFTSADKSLQLNQSKTKYMIIV